MSAPGSAALPADRVAGQKEPPPAENVLHTGGCHCGLVRYTVIAPANLTVYDCNCSICAKKQNRHFVVPHNQFTLLQGKEYLTEYRFNTGQACHMFCRVCGVQSFYQPRSNPEGYGVAAHCLDPGTVKRITVKVFDGQNWEEQMEKDGSIRKFTP